MSIYRVLTTSNESREEIHSAKNGERPTPSKRMYVQHSTKLLHRQALITREIKII